MTDARPALGTGSFISPGSLSHTVRALETVEVTQWDSRSNSFLNKAALRITVLLESGFHLEEGGGIWC